MLQTIEALAKEKGIEAETIITAIEDAVPGARERVRKALERAASAGVLALGPGRARNGKYWYPAGHAALGSPGEQPASKAGSPRENKLRPERQQELAEREPDENGDIAW